MAKFLVHAFVHRIIGKFGDLVVRKRNGQMFLSRAPEPSTVTPTEGQLAVRERFRQASVYGTSAEADPAGVAFYSPIAQALGKSVHSAAVADFLRPPAVTSINLAGFGGQIGHKIAVLAHDDGAVTSVHVLIRTQAGATVEQGQAVFANGAWTYTATTNLVAGQFTVVATAKDRPGNIAVKQEPYLKA